MFGPDFGSTPDCFAAAIKMPELLGELLIPDSEEEAADENESAADGFVAYGIPPEVKEALSKALNEALKDAGPSFGDAIRDVEAVVRRVDPYALIGALTMYYGSAEAGTNPEFNRDGIFGHHIELAQALAFRISPDEHGSEPPTGVMDDVTEAIKRFVGAWTILEAKKIERAEAGDKRNLAMAQVRLRTRAMAVRGWAYGDRMVPMLEALLKPLDDAFQDRLGWRPSALPAWWAAINDAANVRLEAHRAAVRTAMKWPVDDDWLERVRSTFGVLPIEDENQLLSDVRGDDEARRGFIYHSSDLCAHEIHKHDLADLVAHHSDPDISPDVVRALVDSWSVAPGDDCGINAGQLPLANPVLERPFVKSGDESWHLFCPWLLLHSPFALIEGPLSEDDGLFNAYLDRRANFLEERCAALFASALPGATVEHSVLHDDPADGREYENDVLVVVDSHSLVAEAKAGRIGPEARRGRGRPLRERIVDLVEKPSEQGQRLARVLAEGSGDLPFRRKSDGSEFDLDLDRIHASLALGITIEPLADLLPRHGELAESGLSSRSADALAYSISLPDLEVVLDVLQHPSEVVHYLKRRTELERRLFVEGDEMDLLGLYLDTGFNLGEREFKGEDILDVTGMSDPIDVWHYRREAGLPAERPAVSRTPWWESMLTKVEERRGPRWPEIGAIFCNVGPPEQSELEQAMRQLRAEVVGGARSESDVLIFHNGPPKRRDAFIGVIATSSQRGEREKQYERAAAMAINEREFEHAIVIAWTPKPIESPYFALLYYER